MEKYLLAAWGGFLSGITLSLTVLALVLGTSGCTASHPVDRVDLLSTRATRLDTSLVSLPPYLVPAPVGSTPRQRRQWQKAQAQNLARAGVLPDKVKNSSLATASGAIAVNRPASAIAIGAGSTAYDARKASKGHGSSAVGPGAVASTESAGPSWLLYLLLLIGGAIGWEWLTHWLVPLSWLPWRS
jgi:hypothetical protein